jgi:hypothetical protein
MTTTPDNGGNKEPADGIPFDVCEREGKALLAEKNGHERRVNMCLGELAAKAMSPVGKNYGDHLVGNLAATWEIASCTAWRYRKTWCAWDGAGIVAPEPVSFAVMYKLNGHPDRLAIVTENPKLTKRQAQAVMDAWDEANGDDTDKGKGAKGKAPKRLKRTKLGPTEDWQADEAAGWSAEFLADIYDKGRELKINQKAFSENAEPEVVLGVVAAQLSLIVDLVKPLPTLVPRVADLLRKAAEELEQGMQEETIVSSVAATDDTDEVDTDEVDTDEADTADTDEVDTDEEDTDEKDIDEADTGEADTGEADTDEVDIAGTDEYVGDDMLSEAQRCMALHGWMLELQLEISRRPDWREDWRAAIDINNVLRDRRWPKTPEEEAAVEREWAILDEKRRSCTALNGKGTTASQPMVVPEEARLQ